MLCDIGDCHYLETTLIFASIFVWYALAKTLKAIYTNNILLETQSMLSAFKVKKFAAAVTFACASIFASATPVYADEGLRQDLEQALNKE